MTTLRIPDDLEERLKREASRRGTTPEQLALHVLRDGLPGTASTPTEAGSLYELVEDCIGRFDGSAPPASTPLQSPFTDLLREKQKRGHL